MPRKADSGNTFGALSPYFGTVLNADCDHVEAPAGHAPRLESLTDDGAVGLRVREQDTDPEAGAWIHAENPTEVRR